MITAEILRAKGACEEHIKIFAEAWPDGGPVTLENCLKAWRLGLDLEWAAQVLLTAPAVKAYREAKATAWKAYEEAKAPAWKAYKEATAPAFYNAYVSKENQE